MFYTSHTIGSQNAFLDEWILLINLVMVCLETILNQFILTTNLIIKLVQVLKHNGCFIKYQILLQVE